MALVFIDTRDLETAVAVREAVLADGHDISMVESVREIEPRHAAADEVALVLTSDLEGRASRAMVGLFSGQIPRSPVLGLLGDPDSDRRAEVARELDLDDCLSLPPDPDEIRVVLAQQLERWRIQMAIGIVGRSEAIREVLERIHLMAPVNSTVLLTGESGTGKELAARGIHRLSPRRAKPFIPLNCAALPESLLESELFGHEKGSFTGATSLRRGMFELADRGTLFLDEIAEMPLPTQTRLLRILESQRFMRVGGDEELEVDVRMIAATNRDLGAAVRAGEFRRDLYYRLNVLQIELPPLRGRVEDIPILVRRFVGELSEAHDREFKGLTPESMRILLDYAWPGNVRELRNLIESMVVLAPGDLIRPEDIPAEIRGGGGRAGIPVRTESPPVLAPIDPTEAQLPQMEFIFRTLVELKLDVEDLRRAFERYKDRHPELLEARGVGTEIDLHDLPGYVEPGETEREMAVEPTIPFEAGMTMAELERAAIVATLNAVGGNRRRAAQQLQIGERTLYRKLKEYDIEL